MPDADARAKLHLEQSFSEERIVLKNAKYNWPVARCAFGRGGFFCRISERDKQREEEMGANKAPISSCF
jgi:hypothetical protein